MKFQEKNQLIEFEKLVCRYWEEGELPFLIHLSGGNEDFLIDYFKKNVREGDWILSTHRNHYHALLSGISKDKLLDSILNGNSMFAFSKERNFLSSSILSGTCSIAAGIAWVFKSENNNTNSVHCFLGDGAEDEGHFYESVLMVEGHKLPCKFIIEDNNRSVESSLKERLPTQYRVDWPSCVIRNNYLSTYPHAGNGTSKKIIFKNLSRKK